MLKIVLAPNAFKGCLSAPAVAQAMEEGIVRAGVQVTTIKVPVSDGGDGLADVINNALGGESRSVPVTGPLGDRIAAPFCLVQDTGVAAVEMALASGLALISEAERDPVGATSFGTGELMGAALDAGAGRIVVGLGGSATTDGGTGIAAAFGVRFINKNGAAFRPVGGSLCDIQRIDIGALDPRLSSVTIEAVCDVANPLLGPNGAAAVYGPQKGADAAAVKKLEKGLAHLADIIERDIGVDVRSLPGGGAAGGAGAGLHAFLGASLCPGGEVVFDLVGLPQKMRGADLVLTGEGAIDHQTAHGKAPAGVAALAKAQGVPCIGLAGKVGEELGPLHDLGMTAVHAIADGPMSLDESIERSASLIAQQTEQIIRQFAALRR